MASPLFLLGVGSNAKGSLVSNFIPQHTPQLFYPRVAISWLTHLEGSPESSAAQKETVHQGTNDADMGNQSYLL